MQNKKSVDIVRSSAAEYLTFIIATGDGDVNAIYADENVWLTQTMMGMLYDVGTSTINYHLKKALSRWRDRRRSNCSKIPNSYNWELSYSK